jgi:hypothetical protein
MGNTGPLFVSQKQYPMNSRGSRHDTQCLDQLRQLAKAVAEGLEGQTGYGSQSMKAKTDYNKKQAGLPVRSK